MGDIRAAAATKCRQPLQCFQLSVGGAVVDDEVTSENVNLFSQSVEINFLSSDSESRASEGEEECGVSSNAS
jgi:hypothetical protein